jgi:hypothetical protein
VSPLVATLVAGPVIMGHHGVAPLSSWGVTVSRVEGHASPTWPGQRVSHARAGHWP